MPFIPSAVDGASCHLGKLRREVKKTRECSGLSNKNWSPADFEKVTDEIDHDIKNSGDPELRVQKYKQYGQPYLVSAGIEKGIKFIFTMTPLMSSVASEADSFKLINKRISTPLQCRSL